MRISVFLAMITAVLVAACAGAPSRPLGYTKFGTTQDEFVKDRDECLQQSRRPVLGTYVGTFAAVGESTTTANCGVVSACLDARGYAVDPLGNLDHPPEMVVSCVSG